VTDFEDEFVEMAGSVFERRDDAAVEVHLGRAEAEAVNRLARSRGIEAADLIAEWVRERVHRS
jgi:hypothetical protein